MSVLRRHKLQEKYDTTLVEYEAKLSEVESARKEDAGDFVTLLKSAWWGTSAVAEDAVDVGTLEECRAQCAAVSGRQCSGATFDEASKTCWLRSGAGAAVTREGKVASVRQLELLMGEATTLQDRLANLAKKIARLPPLISLNNTDAQDAHRHVQAMRAVERRTMKQDAGILQDRDDAQIHFAQVSAMYKLTAILLFGLLSTLAGRLGWPSKVQHAARVGIGLVVLSAIDLTDPVTWTAFVVVLGAVVGLKLKLKAST